jgi:hypothetical protein
MLLHVQAECPKSNFNKKQYFIHNANGSKIIKKEIGKWYIFNQIRSYFYIYVDSVIVLLLHFASTTWNSRIMAQLGHKV